MSHHLVRYTQHVRREFDRVIKDMSEEDCNKRVAGINSIAWVTGHLASQEQSYWLVAPGAEPIADLSVVAFGSDPSEPKMSEMYPIWQEVTAKSNAYIESLTEEDLRSFFEGRSENIGSMLTRVIGHYYFHVGQVAAVRRILGYEVPSFVGSQEGAMFE